ncbi:hypothetical protein Efla_001244 [Eimeria flavescens]
MMQPALRSLGRLLRPRVPFLSLLSRPAAAAAAPGGGCGIVPSQQTRSYLHFTRTTPEDYELPIETLPEDVEKLMKTHPKDLDFFGNYWYWRLRGEATVLDPEALPKKSYKQLARDMGLQVLMAAAAAAAGGVRSRVLSSSGPVSSLSPSGEAPGVLMLLERGSSCGIVSWRLYLRPEREASSLRGRRAGIGIVVPVKWDRLCVLAGRCPRSLRKPRLQLVVNEESEHMVGLLELYEYLKQSPFVGPFGTIENPVLVPSGLRVFRIVGCTGGTGDNEHFPLWFRCREGFLYRCGECDQIFMHVRVLYSLQDGKDPFPLDPDVSDVFSLKALEKAQRQWNSGEYVQWPLGEEAVSRLFLQVICGAACAAGQLQNEVPEKLSAGLKALE